MSVQKTEGATMTCQNCKTELVCHMSSYEGSFENKLQWQNQDGTAHYKWKAPGKFDCILPQSQEPKQEQLPDNEKFLEQKQVELKNQPAPESLDQITKTRIESDILLISQIEEIVKEKLNSSERAKIGMYVKLIYERFPQ